MYNDEINKRLNYIENLINKRDFEVDLDQDGDVVICGALNTSIYPPYYQISKDHISFMWPDTRENLKIPLELFMKGDDCSVINFFVGLAKEDERVYNIGQLRDFLHYCEEYPVVLELIRNDTLKQYSEDSLYRLIYK